MTGALPLGRIRVDLDLKSDNGQWRMIDISPTITPNGIISYPGLERRAEAIGLSARNYRIRLHPELYRPLYPPGMDGYEFDAFPYNDSNPPQSIAPVIQNVFLTPATNYPFPSHISVLYGDVRDATGLKIMDALVTEGAKERVITSERGAFALPLRWVRKNTTFPVTARDRENTRTGMITIVVPSDLGKNHTIVIK